jgi:hypothetical protein
MDAEQVARNNARYREANERIESAATEFTITGSIPFICECADPECRDMVLLTLQEYEEIRANPTHFVNRPGHEKLDEGYVEVVRREPGYVVVEKRGSAAEFVTELDPR